MGKSKGTGIDAAATIKKGRTVRATSKIPEEKAQVSGVYESKIPWNPKIAIVGFAPSRTLAPFDDKSWEIWGVNELYMAPDVKRIDVLFELHDYKWLLEGKRHPEHMEWMRKSKIPIWMQEHFEDIPKSLPFPKKQLVDRFGNYFTNTISWEIAMAMHIHEQTDGGIKEIGLWGVDMATDLEYAFQRPSVEYFVGMARGMGIDVKIPSESDLLKNAYLYGFEDGELSIFSTKLKAYQKQQTDAIGPLNMQLQNAIATINQKQGASEAINYILRAFVYPNGNFPSENSKE